MKKGYISLFVLAILFSFSCAALAATDAAPMPSPPAPAAFTPPTPPTPPTPSEPSGSAHAADDGAAISAEDALTKLKEGNMAFLTSDRASGDTSFTRRFELAGGQKPYAVVVGCSDSRVSPELIFSAGLGDIFVIRVAGNVIGDLELGSIEYAVGHLGTKLVAVLGHESCGAVGAAIDGHASGYVKTLVDAIKPGIGGEKDPMKASMANARYAAGEISKRLKLDQDPSVKVVSLYYSLSGKVSFEEDTKQN